MRHPIELELAWQRQADLRAAARSLRETRVQSLEMPKPVDGHRSTSLRISLAR